jgi:hypothetical protein
MGERLMVRTLKVRQDDTTQERTTRTLTMSFIWTDTRKGGIVCIVMNMISSSIDYPHALPPSSKFHGMRPA